jgi:hypothetical protein
MQLELLRDSHKTLATEPMVVNIPEQFKVKLIYRGNILYRLLTPILISKKAKSNGAVVKLIYRGNFYQRRLEPQKPYKIPSAINWRWQ